MVIANVNKVKVISSFRWSDQMLNFLKNNLLVRELEVLEFTFIDDLWCVIDDRGLGLDPAGCFARVLQESNFPGTSRLLDFKM